MKKLSIFLLFIYSLLLQSCSLFDFLKDNDDKDSNIIEEIIIVDEDNDTPFDCIVFREDSAITSYYLLYEDLPVVKNAILSINDSEQTLLINSNDDGSIASIGDGEFTLCFSYNEDNTVNAALVSEEETYLFENIMEVSDLMVNQPYPIINRSSSNPYNDAHIKLTQALSAIASILTEQGVMGWKAFKDLPISTKDAVFSVLRMMWSAVDMSVDNKLVDTITLGLAFAANWGNPWLIAWNLFLNYDTYVDYCEWIWLNLFEMLDSHNNHSDMGIAALKTGIGTLKATLTWSFYADIDLHAYEPSGSHIYYGNKRGDFGFLDHDDREGGNGAIENIFWQSPEPGTYNFYIDYYGPSTYNNLSEMGVCHVSIFYNNKSQNYNIPLASGTKSIASVTVQATSSRNGSAPDVVFSVETIPDRTLDFEIKDPKD